jgi:hypothetical protein
LQLVRIERVERGSTSCRGHDALPEQFIYRRAARQCLDGKKADGILPSAFSLHVMIFCCARTPPIND